MKFDSPSDLMARFADTGMREYGQSLLPARTLSLGPKESLAVALESPKTAALCFDRVWSTPALSQGTPDDIAFSSDTDAEILVALFTHLWEKLEGSSRSADLEGLADEVADRLLDGSLAQAVQEGIPSMAAQSEVVLTYLIFLFGGSLSGRLGDLTSQPLVGFTRSLAGSLTKSLQRGVVPLFPSEHERDKQYTRGSVDVVVSTLRNLQIVDESSLAWSQVAEFRSDPRSRRELRRLLHWLDAKMLGQDSAFIEDELSDRIERYNEALEKHGIQTRLGVLSAILDPRTLVSASTAASGFLLSGQPVWGLLSSGGILAGKALVSLGQARLDVDAVHEANRDIAFVVEMQNRLVQG